MFEWIEWQSGLNLCELWLLIEQFSVQPVVWVLSFLYLKLLQDIVIHFCSIFHIVIFRCSCLHIFYEKENRFWPRNIQIQRRCFEMRYYWMCLVSLVMICRFVFFLQIKSGEKRWYALKDKKLNHRRKGSILLELDFIYNQVSKGTLCDNGLVELLSKQNIPSLIRSNIFTKTIFILLYLFEFLVGSIKKTQLKAFTVSWTNFAPFIFRKSIHSTYLYLITFPLVYFQLKASVRTVNPKEEKYMQPEPKFKISVRTLSFEIQCHILKFYLQISTY